MEASDARKEVVAKQLPEFQLLLQDMKEKVVSLDNHISVLRRHIQEDFDPEKGISLLELKYHLLLSYVINLTQLMLLKSQGHSIAESGPVERLVEIRTVLEKVRPLDHKLRYQIDKLIRMATTGPLGATNDPLHYKPNPANLVSKLADEDGDGVSGEEGEGEGEEEGAGMRLYVPPKLAAVPYEEEGRGRRKAEREKRRALKGSLLEELRGEFTDAPEEIQDIGAGLRKKKEVEADKQMERYEEDNFLRLPRKRGRHELGRGADKMTELTDFSSLRALTREEEKGEEELPAGKRRSRGKLTKAKGKSRKGSRKFKRH